MAAPGNLIAENYYNPYIRDNRGFNTNYPIKTSSDAVVGGNLTVTGSITSGGTGMEGAQTITAASANALAVGANGTTNPTLNVDSSVTNAATGLNVQGEAAAAGVNLLVTSSGTNENLNIVPKGNGGVDITAASVAALAIGANGVTNPALTVITNVAGSVTGLSIQSGTAGNGVNVKATSSGTNEPLLFDAKGSEQIELGTNSTGGVAVNRGLGKAIVVNLTTTSVATQNSTPTAAQMLGGLISHASVTAGGTATLPSGSSMTSALLHAAVGDSITTIYANTGTQTVTITANTGATIAGTAAIPTGKTATITSVLQGGNAYIAYCNVSA